MKNNRFLIWVALLLAFLDCANASAVVVSSLFSTSVMVPNYSAQARQHGLEQALQAVLVKVSGNSRVATLPQVRANLAQAALITKSYGYTRKFTNDGQQQLWLQVKFDSRPVQRILEAAHQSLWGANRPLVVIWLVAPNASGQAELVDHSSQSVVDLIQANADRRGLPTMVPMFDLTDLSKVSAADIENFNVAAIKDATQRYQTSRFLIGYIWNVAGGGFQSKWVLVANERTLTWSYAGDDLQSLISPVIDNVADEFVSNSAVVVGSGMSEKVKLLVTNVHDLSSVAEVTRYLQSLNGVSRIELVAVQPNAIRVNIVVSGGVDGLANLLRSSDSLTIDANSDDSNVDKVYQWQANS